MHFFFFFFFTIHSAVQDKKYKLFNYDKRQCLNTALWGEVSVQQMRQSVLLSADTHVPVVTTFLLYLQNKT